MATLYSFWRDDAARHRTYRGAPSEACGTAYRKEHFERWLELFLATVAELFSGRKAERRKAALSIADTFCAANGCCRASVLCYSALKSRGTGAGAPLSRILLA
jgi:hypothetical protein